MSRENVVCFPALKDLFLEACLLLPIMAGNLIKDNSFYNVHSSHVPRTILSATLLCDDSVVSP